MLILLSFTYDESILRAFEKGQNTPETQDSADFNRRQAWLCGTY